MPDNLDDVTLERSAALLADLVRVADLPTLEPWAATLWPTPGSLKWFVREHAESLAAQNVFLKLRGEWFARRSLLPPAVCVVLGIDISQLGGGAE